MLALTVPPFGVPIYDDVLSIMLSDSVLGSSNQVDVKTPAESHYFLNVETTYSLQQPRPENTPLLFQRPGLRHVLFVTAVSTVSGRPHDDNGLITGDHFVVLHVDIEARTAALYDSLPTTAVQLYFRAALLNLSKNIFGHSMIRFQLIPADCEVQSTGSADCAIHAWKNTAILLTRFHVVPVFNGLVIDPVDICRDTFRLLYHLVCARG